MKICYVITKADLGGAQRYLSQIVNDQVLRKTEVSVACGTNGDWLPNQIKVSVTRINLRRSWNPFSFLVSQRSLLKWLRVERPDIVHFHSSHAFFGIPVAKKSGAQTIITIHGLSYYNESGIKGLLYRLFLGWAVRSADHVVCVCESDQKVIQRKYGLSDNKLSVIYPGVSSVAFFSKQDARGRLGIPGDSTVIGTLGRFDYQKNQVLLLDSFARLQFPNSYLCLIGQGPFEERLKYHAKELGISDRIVFSAGSAQFLKAFDEFVLPSRFEGFPYVLLEAGLAKVPVVSMNVGGVNELIESGHSGIICNDEGTLLNNIPIALSSGVQLSENLYQTVTKSFTEERLVDSHDRLYRRLLKLDV